MILCTWCRTRIGYSLKMASKRPERQAPADIFYNEEEAQKYTTNSRIMEIQSKMTERALELLNLPKDEPAFLLDVGCGSGLSGDTITEHGHYWIGFDLSQSMLDVAVEREVEGDVFVQDAGQGIMFRPGTFDGCISISALQWLCNADKSWHNPIKRLRCFFTSLFSSLARGCRAVLQFYPDSPDQIELITSQAMRAGFTGGVVVDYPNSTRAKKMFLCLFAGVQMGTLPKGLGTGDEDEEASGIAYSGTRQRSGRPIRGQSVKKSKQWIKDKKERQKRQGKKVKEDSKYSGRKRKVKF